MIEQFVTDLAFEHQLYAVIIRAPVSSGIISAVQLPSLPADYAFYGAAQIPAQQTIEIFEQTLPIFAEEEILYREQAIGILTGTDMARLESLRKDIWIEMEAVPEDSFEAGHPHTLFDYPIIARDSRTAGNIDAVFETAKATVYSSLKIASQYTARSEPFSVITVFREDGLDVYVPTQWPFHVRAAVAKAVGLAEDAVVVYPTGTGETFNELLWYPSLLACQCAVAAVIQQRTVALNFSAEESRIAAPKTPEMIIEHKSALSDTKRIAAMQISIIVNAGACCPLIDKILKQMTAAALGPYQIPNYQIEARASKTAEGLIDIFEGWGDYYTVNALENHIGKIIQEYNLSPTEWRLENIPEDYAGVFLGLFKTLVPKSDFTCKHAAYHVFNQGKTDKHDGRWRGIGLAAGFQYSGCAADFTYTVEMELNIHNRLSIKAEPAAEEVKKIIRKLAVKKLEIAESDIVFTGLTTADMNLSGPATAGYPIGTIVPLVEQCLTDLQEQRFRNPLPLAITRSSRVPNPESSVPGEENGSFFVSKTPAACIVELELDPVCYAVMIRKVWVACNPGKVYETKQMLSHLHKNIAGTLSRTCKEALQTAESESPTLPYSEYRLMLPNEMPPLSIELLKREQPMSAFDSCALNILPAAYLTALNQILLRVPAQINTLPVLTDDIFKALTGNK